MALAGPNGSGKTTLLKLMTGILAPESGTVYLGGRPLAEISPRERGRHIAVVSQHVDPTLSFRVEAMVAMGRAPHTGLFSSPSSRDREVVESALRSTEMERFAHRRFNELSGGEQQRVALAMALAQETDFLLLDEPTLHLDLHFQHQLLELLTRLHREHAIGIIAVMHDLNLASLYFERLALLHDGRLIDDRAPGDVLTSPAFADAFRTPLQVITHPQTGAVQVLLERGQY